MEDGVRRKGGGGGGRNDRNEDAEGGRCGDAAAAVASGMGFCRRSLRRLSAERELASCAGGRSCSSCGALRLAPPGEGGDKDAAGGGAQLAPPHTGCMQTLYPWLTAGVVGLGLVRSAYSK
jgi:hypothetical protein